MPGPASVLVRDSRDADVPAVAAIYAHWVRHGLASFELDPPDEAEMGRRGVGRTLLPALLARLEAGSWRQVVAVIGDSGNLSSISLHRACGFRPAGVLPAVGWKHGRWVDSVLMTRPLGPGAGAPPPDGK